MTGRDMSETYRRDYSKYNRLKKPHWMDMHVLVSLPPCSVNVDSFNMLIISSSAKLIYLIHSFIWGFHKIRELCFFLYLASFNTGECVSALRGSKRL